MSEQLFLLKGHVDDWNAWRRQNSKLPIDLSRADLRKGNLRGANLSGADLSATDFSGADLMSAELTRANLSAANLTAARLAGANLTAARLIGANLSEARLAGANLRGADLSAAKLGGANLSEAKLVGANLRGANLGDAKLGGANLSEADLVGANLIAARLAGANLSGADLSDASFDEADFVGVDLEKTIFITQQFCIYTESSSIEDAQELYQCGKAFYDALGFSIGKESDWFKGSLWKAVFARLEGLTNAKELVGRARVAENVLLGQYDRESAIALTKAVVELETAFKGKKGAIVIDLGLFVFLRKSSRDGDGAVYFKRLTVEERF